MELFLKWIALFVCALRNNAFGLLPLFLSLCGFVVIQLEIKISFISIDLQNLSFFSWVFFFLFFKLFICFISWLQFLVPPLFPFPHSLSLSSQPHPLLLYSVQKGADFPRVSTKHGVSGCSKTKSYHLGWGKQSMRSRLLRASHSISKSPCSYL